VIVLLVRHGRAGDRSKWEGDDRLRPLDGKGRRQAKGLDCLLADYSIDRILSSPYIRCVQTVEPLAAARGVALEEVDELAEGGAGEDVLRLLAGMDARCTVLCTHGDVVHELIGEEMKKGATEALELDEGRLSRVRSLGRPTT
jgi:broad specificity phosphatase PhoE